MKKIEIFNGMCYSKKLEFKMKLKAFAIYACSTLAAAAVVAGGTFAFIHFRNQTSGQGGLDTPGLPLYADAILENDKDLPVAENFSDLDTLDNKITYFTYRVKSGDMIGMIAEKYGVTQDTIISVNQIRSSRLIQIGQYLRIPSEPGILYTVKTGNETVESISKKYNVDAQRCALLNNLSLDEELSAGKTLFVPDALLDWVTRQEINGDLFKRPLKGGYYISSPYGYRKNPFDSSRRTFHSGIDMACKTGTSIYAALDGTVTTAGWSNTYGNYVIITHHSGYKSLYGHMSQILVKKGAHVTTSTVIGKVGSTGLSTGPHLHFTVYKNGITVSPSSLWN